MDNIFGNKAANQAKAQANYDRAAEQYRQDTIKQGTTNVDNVFNTQFTPDFYTKQQQGYVDYATPQLEDQFSKAKQQLTYALTRTGSLDSSARASKEAELQQTYDLAKQGIRDQGLSYANNARNSVEDARSSLLTALNASGDAVGATNNATARSTALSAAPSYSPLGQIFGDFTNALAVQAGAEKAASKSYQSPYSTGLFAPKRDAVKVTP